MSPSKTEPKHAALYKSFKFRLIFEGRCVAGVQKVSALKRTTEPVELRKGGDAKTARMSPGATKFEPITLERGLTHDPVFESWANQVNSPGAPSGAGKGLAGSKRDLELEVCNEAGKVVTRYGIFRCWVSEFQAMPELDASAKGVAIKSLVLQHEGFKSEDA